MMHIGILGRIAICVVILLVLVWLIHTVYKSGYLPDGAFKDTYESMIQSAYRQYDKYIESPINLYSKTTGYENDDVVKIAVDKLERTEHAHKINESNGQILSTTANDAAVNAFVLAELNRFNIAPNLPDLERIDTMIKADQMYARALRRIQNNAQNVVQYNTITDPTPETMLFRIEDYMRDRNIPIQHTIDDARRDIRTARKKITPKKQYFAPRVIRNDPQNVHDTGLNNDLKTKFAKIQNSNQIDELMAGAGNYQKPTLDNIEYELKNSALDKNKKQHIQMIIDLAKNKNIISSLNTTDDNVLIEVWRRINSAENINNRDELKKSLWDSMASAVEKNYSDEYNAVCTVGRVCRILDSLTLLDASPQIAAAPKTTEILRNEIFEKSGVILQNRIKNAEQIVNKVYEFGQDEATLEPSDKAKLDEFKKSVKEEISTTIKLDYPNSKPDIIEKIIQDAQAGVDI